MKRIRSGIPFSEFILANRLSTPKPGEIPHFVRNDGKERFLGTQRATE